MEESHSQIPEPIVIEDNASIHKGACTKSQIELKWPVYEHPLNSPDLDPIEHI